VIHLRDYQLPLYNQEIEDEQGLPKEALALKTLFMDHEGLLLACPEYNSSMTAVFKNTIDWVSRKATRDEDDLSCFVGKVVTLMSASPGPLGGLRGLVHVRSLFSCLYSLVLPRQKSIPFADRAFDGEGNLLKTQDQADTLRLGRELAEFLMR
ncbi:MAG: NAD(P)H-dependent oxidoreductase, partial [Chlamydiae bacterium]|nr:NAD(P)H-dependent oxidoreductase [Chlamydiota bacterium]